MTSSQMNIKRNMNISWNSEVYQSKYCRILINASEKLNGKHIIQINNTNTSEIYIYERPNIKWIN
jgi:hypothetical protein